jgi:hypothetical protein
MNQKQIEEKYNVKFTGWGMATNQYFVQAKDFLTDEEKESLSKKIRNDFKHNKNFVIMII